MFGITLTAHNTNYCIPNKIFRTVLRKYKDCNKILKEFYAFYMLNLRNALLCRLKCCHCYLVLLLTLPFAAGAQANNALASVLANGSWYKISVAKEGMYKIDAKFLSSLGFSLPVASRQLRLFGNGGGMLPEANQVSRPDDLIEVAIEVFDGGDGLISGSDYILFYAPGPHQWKRSGTGQEFYYQTNLYSNKAYYFLTLGATGKRVSAQQNQPAAQLVVTNFDEHFAHELEAVNFLSSGKTWYGEAFSDVPGQQLAHSIALPFNNVLPGSTATLRTSVAARSVNVGSSFNVAYANTTVQQILVPPIGSGFFDAFAQEASASSQFTIPAPGNLVITYKPGSFNSQGWLNKLELFCQRQLAFINEETFTFRNWNTVQGNTAGFIISGGAGAQVWDITNAAAPKKMNGVAQGKDLQFANDAGVLHEYVCFKNGLLIPEAEGSVPNQNLHATTETDYFIVTAPQLLQQAERLAAFHRQHSGLRTTVVTTTQVYNEFSSGTPDPAAIRDFIRLYYKRYNSTWRQSGKYLLLLGKASFNYKNQAAGASLVPPYESNNSLDPLVTYTSDDFFGFLDDEEDINSGLVLNTLDIGIGRIPAASVAEAQNYVDKVLDYYAAQSLGPWRNNINIVADDEDQNLHLQDAEVIAATTSTLHPLLNIHKVYLDAFQQEGGSAGGRYPQANAVVASNLNNGTLIWNYNGHGGPTRLAEETILDEATVGNLSNRYRLPLMITATCDFAPFDNPFLQSLGEGLLLKPKVGAIALMTTTRPVFAFSNRILNNNYIATALQPDGSGNYKTLGAAVKEAKNLTYQTSADVVNNRKFSLLGDPAMRLAFPKLSVMLTHVNGSAIGAGTDTLKAASMVTLQGKVAQANGQVIENFTGTVYLTLFDKEEKVTTLANDPTSQPAAFTHRSSILFRGKATVESGLFFIKFKLPKDINYQFGPGKASLYAEDGQQDAAGFNNQMIVGGKSPADTLDRQGPQLRAYLNDEKFVNGSIVNSRPLLLVKLTDSSGINTGSSGIGHDLVATLDGDNNKYYVLNNYYESSLDNYQKGTVRFQLPELEPGNHSLKIKAWDVMNNSGETGLDFTVVNSSELKIAHVLNYPNPFTTHTAFWFEHNQPGLPLRVKVEIYTVSGKLVKTLAQTINTAGNRSSEIEWNGTDEFGNKMGRGVYLYYLTVQAQNGKQAGEWQRLVIL